MGKAEVIAAFRGNPMSLDFRLASDVVMLIFAYLLLFAKIYLVAKYSGLISAPSFLSTDPWEQS